MELGREAIRAPLGGPLLCVSQQGSLGELLLGQHRLAIGRRASRTSGRAEERSVAIRQGLAKGHFALDDHSVQSALVRQPGMPGCLGDHREERTEGGMGTGSIDPGHEASILALRITRCLHLIHDRVRVREDADLVQHLVIDVRPHAKVKSVPHRSEEP